MARLTPEEIAVLREQHKKPPKCEIYRDSMQNFKKYGIPHAQLIIADIPYNVGTNFYGSNPMWYNGGDNKNGESKLAGKAAFNSDFSFNLYEYFNFAKQMMKPEPTEKITKRGGASNAPCMIVFCALQQIPTLIDAGAKQGFGKYIHVSFIKNYSPQVLKANMRIVGATEHALVMYRNRLPKFNNNGRMVFDWMNWEQDGANIPKIHPAQKPVALLKKLIELFTDEGDVVIDPCCGSGSTIRAAKELGREAYGFEIDKNFYKAATEKMLNTQWNPDVDKGIIQLSLLG